ESPMPRVGAVRPDVPPAVDELIQKACAKDRAQRFQTCEELCAAIDKVATSAPPSQTVPDLEPPVAAFAAVPPRASEQVTAQPGPGRAGSRRGLLYAGAGAIVVAAVVAALMLLGVVPKRNAGAKPVASHDQRPPPPVQKDAGASPLEALAGAWVA